MIPGFALPAKHLDRGLAISEGLVVSPRDEFPALFAKGLALSLDRFLAWSAKDLVMSLDIDLVLSVNVTGMVVSLELERDLALRSCVDDNRTVLVLLLSRSGLGLRVSSLRLALDTRLVMA